MRRSSADARLGVRRGRSPHRRRVRRRGSCRRRARQPAAPCPRDAPAGGGQGGDPGHGRQRDGLPRAGARLGNQGLLAPGAGTGRRAPATRERARARGRRHCRAAALVARRGSRARRLAGSRRRRLLAVGQDAAFAADLARRFSTVGGILAGLDAAIVEQIRSASRDNPLAEGAALAQSHGTRYPIVQGPMTRVSDRAAFAAAVAEGGALPFLALALMRGPEVAQAARGDASGCSATGRGASASSASSRPSCARSSSRRSARIRRRSR